jgi:gas vesicle protein
MKSSKGGVAFGAFLGGMSLGVLVSLLFAPQSGEETRELIAKKARRAGNLMGEAVGTVSEGVDDLRSQMAESVADTKNRVQDAVQAGKDAYHQEMSRGAHA